MGGQKQNRLYTPLLFVLCCTAGVKLLAIPLLLQAQVEPTATPDAEGVIYSEVRPGDSLWAVAARAGIPLPELLELNDLSENDIIQPGQLLIIGYGTVAPTATPDLPATSTGTRPPPTPTNTAAPAPQTGICLLAFTDTNGNGRREAGEALKAAVAFTVFNEQAVIANYVTDGLSEPYCLEGLAAGDYQVTRSVESGETLTSSGDRGVILTDGNVIYLDFGSYSGAAPAAEATAGNGEFADAPAGTPAAIQVTPAPQAGPASAGALSGRLLATVAGVGGLLLFVLILFLARNRRLKKSCQLFRHRRR